MFKLKFNGSIDPAWEIAARNRVKAALAFLPVDLSRVEISLTRIDALYDATGHQQGRQHPPESAYRCRIRCRERTGLLHVVCCRDADPYQALEHAFYLMGESVLGCQGGSSRRGRSRTVLPDGTQAA